MADKFTGLSLSWGGLMEFSFPYFPSVPSGSASGGVVVTAFGGPENNGMGLYGSIGTDKVDGDGGYSKGPYFAPWSSKFYGLFVGEEATLTYGNADAVSGFSAIYGLHLGVAGLQIGIPFQGNGYSIGVTLGPGLFVNLGTVQGTATLTTQDIGPGGRVTDGSLAFSNEFQQYQELVGDAQPFVNADSLSSGSPTHPAIPYLQESQQFSQLFSPNELTQSLEQMVSFSGEVNQAASNYANNLSSPSQNGANGASTKLTYDDGNGNRVSDATGWQVTAEDFASLNGDDGGLSGGFSGGWSGGSSGWSGGWTGVTGGTSGGSPVVLDLTGQGIHVTPRTSSNQYFDMAGDGYQHATAWAGAGNGVLVLDLNDSGVIKQANQVNFRLWDPTATSDMQALLDVFDTNHNGKLDAGDGNWSKFKILVTNADGTTTLRTLAELGIVSIDLIANNQSIVLPDGSAIKGQTTYTKSDGTTGAAADVTFAYDSKGYVVQSTVAHNADGSTTIDNKAFGANGNLAEETIRKTSADGKTITLSRDTNGDGIVDVIETDVTVTNADGGTTLTVSNFDAGGGHLASRSVTTTSADRKVVTINRDSAGRGTFDQVEVDAKDATGALTVTISDLNPDGTTRDRVVTTTNASGLSKTTQSDAAGSGRYDLTIIDNIVINGNGSRTETVSSFNEDNSLRSRVVTLTSADHLTKTTQYDSAGSGIFDRSDVETVAVGSDGGITTTQQVFNADASLRSKVITVLSADGLSRTTQSDLNGDAVFDVTRSDVTVVNADGGRTETVTDRNADSTVRDRSVTTQSSDGRNRTMKRDTNGDGGFEYVETIAPSANGSTLDTVERYSRNGALQSRSVATTSSDGLSIVTESDLTGDGVADRTRTDLTTVNADGSRTHTIKDASASGASLGKLVVTTSADGLSKRTQYDSTGAGSFDLTRNDVTVINPDGSTVETVQDTNANDSRRSTTVTTISANRAVTTIEIDADGDQHRDQVQTRTLNANGSIDLSVVSYAANGSLVGATMTATSANGLTITTKQDLAGAGNGAFDLKRTDVTVLNADGSRTQTVTDTSSNGSVIRGTRSTTSANGLSVEVQTDSDGIGGYEQTRTDTIVIGADGSRTETISDRTGGGVLLARSVMTTSASSLSVTIQKDSAGSGSFDQVSKDVTELNADGSRTETISMFAGDGTLTGRAIVATSADGATVTTWRDRDSDGAFEQKEIVTVAANGSTVKTLSDYTPSGVLIDSAVISATANGLSVTTQYDSNGDGNFDKSRTDVTVLNVDGSKTETITETDSNNHLIDKAVIQTNASGLVKITQEDVTGSGSFSLKETDVATLGVDGSQVRTVTSTNASDVVLRKTTTTISGDRKTQSVSRDVDGNGIIDQTVTSTIIQDGSKVSTLTDFTSSGVLKDRTVVTASANGLSVKTERDTTGAGSFNQQTTTDVTVLNADGSRTETITYMSGSTVKDRTVVQTTANDLSKMTQWDLNGDGSTDETQVDATSLNADGSVTRTVSIYTGTSSGVLKGRSVETTSGNGLSKSIQWTSADSSSQTLTDIISINADGSRTETVTAAQESKVVTTVSANGQQKVVKYDNNLDGFVDKVQTTTTSRNADGSHLDITADYDGNGSLSGRSVKTTSADGRVVSIARDVNGDSVTDQAEIDITAIDGSKTSIITDLSPAGAVLGKTIVSTSADELTTTTQWQFNGTGMVNRTRTDAITKNADGSTSESVIDRNSDGTLYQQGVTTTSADGRLKTLQQQTAGKSYFDHTEVTTVNVDGSSTTIAKNVSSTGGLVDQTNTTISADGLTKKVDQDTTGSGTFNYHATTSRRIDGSTITDATSFDATAQTTKHIVTTVSADGLTTVVQTDLTNDGSFDSTETTVTRIDGSTVATKLDQSSGNSKTVTETSANQADKVSYTFNQDGSYTSSIWTADRSQSWSYLSNSYDSTGRLLSQKGTYNNGQSWVTTYDLSGTQSWVMQSQDFNADGQLVSVYIANDDNTSERRFFDPTDVADWLEVSNRYDAQGVLTAQYGKYDSDVYYLSVQLGTWYNDYQGYNPNYWAGDFDFEGYVTNFIGTTYSAIYHTRISPDGTVVDVAHPQYGNAETGWDWNSPDLGPMFSVMLGGGISGVARITDNLGSFFDFQRGIVQWISDWASLPTNVAFPTGGAALLGLINKTIADAGLVGTLGNDTVNGTSGADHLSGFAGNDSLYGLAGDDVLDGGAGADNLVGGAGNDTYNVDNASDVVVENANDGNDAVRSSISYVLGANVENLTLTGGASINGTGNALANVIVGNDGNNVLSGLGGSDTIDGGAGTDTVVFSGNRANYSVAYNPTTKVFAISDLRSGSPDGVDSLSNVETFQFADGTVSAQTFATPNHAPSGATMIGGTVPENSANGTVIGTVTGADPDWGAWFTYSLVNNAGGRFAIDMATGVVSVANGALLDYETTNSHNITVRVTDQGGLTVDKTFTIGITNVNEAATGATLSANSVAENSANGTVVGTVSGTDPDAGATLSYSLANNAGGRFAINSTTGVITVANGTLLDYETASTQSITVRVTDQGGLTFDKAFTVNITNAVEGPTGATMSGGSVAENAVAGAVVGTISGIDPEAGTALSYALTNNAGGRFAINATTGVVTIVNGALLDYEASPSQTIVARVTDQGGRTYDKSFTINLTNVNEAPTNITLSNSSVMEHSSSQTVIGSLAGVDPDAGSTFTYSLTDSAGGIFQVTSGGVLQTAGDWHSLDYATATSKNLTVKVTDQGGLSYTKTFTIGITPDHTTVTHGDGSTTTTIYDAPNLYSWSSFRTEANAQGAPTYQIGYTDGGGNWQNEYDVGSTQSWTTRMTVTNAAQQVVSRTTVNDNNTLTLVANDVSGAYSWATFTMQFTWNTDTGWNYSSTSGVNDTNTTNLDMNEVWSSFDTLLWYSNPYVVTQGSLGGGDDGLPVILDLDGNGVDVTPLGSSSAFYNMDGGPGRVHTAWVGGNDGLLAIDLAANGGIGPDGVIDQAKEIAFSAWAPGSTSDMAALRQVFDTNHDGQLSSGDERWGDFRIWQDSNGDGFSQAGEVHGLSDFGISSIDLNPTGTPSVLSDGSVIQGLSSYTRTDGTTGLAGDVALATDPGWRRPDPYTQLVQAMAFHSDDRGFLPSPELLASQYDQAAQGTLTPAWRPAAAG
ncbi:hypothetical protein ABH975_002362 [Bradyrhizobium ottawaense]|uniref:beta strand repeat-containing protein n=1 Tax=Bradyrhizobium ottawaense TaxID=931866 RepID=UPI00351686FB